MSDLFPLGFIDSFSSRDVSLPPPPSRTHTVNLRGKLGRLSVPILGGFFEACPYTLAAIPLSVWVSAFRVFNWGMFSSLLGSLLRFQR